MIAVRVFARLLAILVALAGASPTPAAPLPYESLAGRKALAEVPGNGPAIYGIAHSQDTDTAASQSALLSCEARRPHAAPSCEINRLNDEAITSGAEIRSRATARAHPLYLWQYRSPTATVFLVGSIHVLKPSLYPLPVQVEQAFDQADYLVLEVDTQSVPAADLQAQSTRHALLPGEQTLADVLPTLIYQRLNEHLTAYGMSTAAVARAKPAVIMNELVFARLAALGYRPEHGVEQHFRAKAGTRQILELESIETQLALLFDQPLDTQIQLLADTLDQEYLIEPLLTGMLVAWLSGDDERLLELFEQQAGDSKLAEAFNRQLLDERNIGMANKVRNYLNGRGTYFVLAGAAHFTGPRGIIALLLDHGLAGHRMMSNEHTPAVVH